MQNIYDLGVKSRVGCRDDTTTALRGSPVPAGDRSAGLLDYRDEGDDVVWLAPGLHNDVDLTGGEHAIGIAIGPVPRKTHLPLQLMERGPLPRFEDRGGRREERGFAQVFSGAG